jgi:hypothetical protein
MKGHGLYLTIAIVGGIFFLHVAVGHTAGKGGDASANRSTIESRLPRGKTLATASKEDVAAAIRAAIQSARAGGCDKVAAMASAAVNLAPSQAASTLEFASRIAPDCVGALEHTTHIAKVEGADDSEQATTAQAKNAAPAAAARRRRKCPVCHNGHEVLLPCKQVPKFLRIHPGDTAGHCGATPDKNL